MEYMTDNYSRIDGILSIIDHYYKSSRKILRPLLSKNNGCLVIEEFATYLFSEDIEKIDEYDFRFDLMHRCDNIGLELEIDIENYDYELPDHIYNGITLGKLKNEINIMAEEYFISMKEYTIQFFNRRGLKNN